MTSIKVKFRPSSVDGKKGTLYYQVIHNRAVRQIRTGCKLAASEWDESSETIVLPQNQTTGERKAGLRSMDERIKSDKEKLDEIVKRLSLSGTFTADNVVAIFHERKQNPSFCAYVRQQIARLKIMEKTRTSETYAATLRSFCKFLKNKDISFDEINAELLAEYEFHLKRNGNSPNTVSFYMRILKAAYNRAAENGLTEQRHPFNDVYTGVGKTAKRAIPIEAVRKIKNQNFSQKANLDFARDMFLFSFYTRGMSFVDMAYLKKKDIRNGFLAYRRRKTGRQLFIRWEKCMRNIVDKYPENKTDFLLPIITATDKSHRTQYASGLRRVNRLLKEIGEQLNLPMPLTMYVARHSWASIAKSQNVPISVISEGLGHDSETTTRIYLASLDNAVVDDANRKILKLL